MLLMLSAVAASDGHMNPGLPYLIANAAPGHEKTPRGFAKTSSFFEVYSPPIKSRYAGVVWRVLDPVALPADIVAKYNNSAMAVTGYEVDVVRRGKGSNGGDHSVPNYQSYNHHFTSHLHGAGTRLAAGAVGTPNLRHRLPYEPTALLASPDGVPHIQAFNEHNGNEARVTYHGLPAGFAQPLLSPQTFVFNPMQINTLNPDGSGKRGGPLPRASAAPKGAAYSGLLECPCTTRVVKDVAKGTINGHSFGPNVCTGDKRASDLNATHNPTCSVATYAGGMECCHDEDILLDSDQTQPVSDVASKWRGI